MTTIDEVQARIRQLYSKSGGGPPGIPLPIRALVYSQYARDYLEAASVLYNADRGDRPRLLMPWCQLLGQAFELALKSCLGVDGVDPPHSHDLVALYRRVEGRGFDSNIEHIEAHLVHLNHAYFEDLASGDRFTARYGGEGPWSVPDHDRLAAACMSFIEQSEGRNPILPQSPLGRDAT